MFETRLRESKFALSVTRFFKNFFKAQTLKVMSEPRALSYVASTISAIDEYSGIETHDEIKDVEHEEEPRQGFFQELCCFKRITQKREYEYDR